MNTFCWLLFDLNFRNVRIQLAKKQQQLQKHLLCERRVGRGSSGNNAKVFHSLGRNLATENISKLGVSSHRNHGNQPNAKNTETSL